MTMKWLKLIIFLLCMERLNAQTVNLNEFNFNEDKAVNSKTLSNSEDASSFIIEIKDTIKPHFHKVHTELIYIISGEAKFYFDKKQTSIKKGDFFEIPRMKVHAVKVTSKEPLKVLSVQAPEFKGEDRIYVD